MLSKKNKLDEVEEPRKGHASTYSQRYFDQEIPKYQIPEKSMPANAAYQLIHDELSMDANASLNLASFVTTWMEPEVVQLMNENMHKNFIDHDEYPQTEIIHNRCINMLARLFNAPEEANSIGTSTIGSSEAIMLALLAHKWSWKKRRIKEGKPYDRPNVIFGAEVHVCWEKFARYFDVEMRMVPLAEDCFVLRTDEVEKLIDENTIAVGAILGTTYSGQSDPIEQINALLLKIKKERGLDIPLHIDAASGGFVVPFSKPEFKWDFRLEQVKSINVSGHKYGLVYPGVGWVLWKDESDFPEELVFKVDYLGGWMPTYTLNFSRGSNGVLGQYYNFLRLGKEGYCQIVKNCLDNASYLSDLLEKSEKFTLIHRGDFLPIVAMKLKKDVKGYTVFDISDLLRERGWVMAAYTMPANAEHIALLRVVVRENLSRDMIDVLFADIMKACKTLETKKREAKKSSSKEKHRPIC